MPAKPKTVAEYIRACPKEGRTKLRELRGIIRKAVPGADESLKWGMPAVSKGKIIVMYAAFKDHVSFFPTGSGVKAFAKNLEAYKTSKGTIQFPFDAKLPAGLIRRITQYRLKETLESGKAWR
jgi:uncharacterized protein YdhG (YjbR/CyaY superfamily)